MTPTEIKAEASRRAMNASGLSATERKAFAAKVEADLRAEAEAEEQAKAAAAIAAEASAERARVSGVIRVGADLGRPRQAARLALTTSLDPAGAKALLSTLPPDMQAAPEALAIPSEFGAFGTPSAQAERRRIAAILGNEEAEGRFQAATALAFSTALDPAQAVAALMAAPRQQARIEKSLEQRSREAGEFGADLSGGAGRSKGERINDMWSNAVKQANASIGAAPTGPAADAVPPNPSITDAERAALRGAVGLPGGALTDLARARDARAEASELALAISRRDVIPDAEAEVACDFLCGVISDRIGGLPARVTRDLRDRRLIEGALVKAQDGIAKDLAAAQDVAP